MRGKSGSGSSPLTPCPRCWHWSGWQGVRETRPQAAAQPIESRPISGQLLALMGIVLVTGASTAMVWPLLMVFLQDALQADVAALVWAYLPAALISAFLPSRMGRIADRLGRKSPMIAGLIVGAAASALIPHLRSILPLIVLWAVESLGYTALMPAERAFVADIAGQDTRGTSYGLYTFAYFLGAALGPLAGGWLYDNIGHATPFYLNAVGLVVGALLVAGVLRDPDTTRIRRICGFLLSPSCLRIGSRVHGFLLSPGGLIRKILLIRCSNTEVST